MDFYTEYEVAKKLMNYARAVYVRAWVIAHTDPNSKRVDGYDSLSRVEIYGLNEIEEANEELDSVLSRAPIEWSNREQAIFDYWRNADVEVLEETLRNSDRPSVVLRYSDGFACVVSSEPEELVDFLELGFNSSDTTAREAQELIYNACEISSDEEREELRYIVEEYELDENKTSFSNNLAGFLKSKATPEEPRRLNYKRDFPKVYLGGSDIARLIAEGIIPNDEYPTENGVVKLKHIHFGGDGCYSAHDVITEHKSDIDIPEHYHLVESFTTWLNIYDDKDLRLARKSPFFDIYRAGDYGMLIHTYRVNN